MEEMDDCRELIRENIDYADLLRENPWDAETIDGYVELMVEACCTTRDSVRICGQDVAAEVVKSRFLKLNGEHILYVMTSLKENTTKVANIKAYILSALYNAPVTMGQYYTSRVSHDMAKEINILVVEPGKPPRPARARNTLETFTEIVGGPVEAGCYLPQRVMPISRERGSAAGLPPNRISSRDGEYIPGTFLLCGFTDNRFVSLTPMQQAEFQKKFAKPGEFMMAGAETVCANTGELAMAACRLWERMKDGESIVLTEWGGQKDGEAV